MSVKQKDIKVGTTVKLGKILAVDSKAISEKVATVTGKFCGDSSCSVRFQVQVEGVVHPWNDDNTFNVYLRNIKEILPG